MGKKSRRRPKGGSSGVKEGDKMPPASGLGIDSNENPRPYEEMYGRVFTLKVQSERYHGKRALCVGYDDKTERLVVWPLETANQILVEPLNCDGRLVRYTIDDCRREIRERQSEERRRTALGEDKCSICLEPPRAPVELPCLHRFCGSCIARLRSPREEDFELQCPNCRAPLPAMFEQLEATALGITRRMVDDLVCSDPGCANRHIKNGVLVTEEAILHLKNMHDKAVETKDIMPYILALEDYVSKFTKSATLGHPLASEVKAHRDIFRRMVCQLLPEVKNLRSQYEGCLQVRSTCGGIDSQLEDLFMKIYGRPLLSPEEQRERLAGESSQFNQAKFDLDESQIAELTVENDGKFTEELMMLVLKNLDGVWCYIKSFGRHYDRVLLGFCNAVGRISSDPIMCKTLTEEMGVVCWTMRRLDAMEELLEKGTYGKFEAEEAFLLLQLLYNVIFPAIGVYQVQLDIFIRQFGQDYILREIEGAIDPKAREGLACNIGRQLRKISANENYVDEFNRPLLLLRPCATPRYGGMHPQWCRMKESHPNEFIRCKCKRMAYCSPSCMHLHEDSHAKACAEALRSRKRMGANHNDTKES